MLLPELFHFSTDNCNKLSLSLFCSLSLSLSLIKSCHRDCFLPKIPYGVHAADTKYFPILKTRKNDPMENYFVPDVQIGFSCAETEI